MRPDACEPFMPNDLPHSDDLPAHTDLPDSAAIYNPLVLRLYDLWVTRFSNRFAWRCPAARQIAHYRAHLADRHLDVGVGTGFYLQWAGEFGARQVALLDPNPDCLATARARLGQVPATVYRQDALDPLVVPEPPFGSIGLSYLLHCLPGPMARKAAIFDNLRPLLAPGGTLFGSTILGDGAGHNPLGRKLMAVYNAKGIFGNAEDTLQALDRELSHRFATVRIEQVGVVALFSAAGPKA
ncbi:methyltransferase [Aliidongia dinghuensis]|uniref:Methyltransferase n=2 Tax=Aliidongia dinghuensis TaxID=1867774 RepID=A0A8J3E1W1_9PROT|nr:methyltransferase [Aliidongia dinghuensis]